MHWVNQHPGWYHGKNPKTHLFLNIRNIPCLDLFCGHSAKNSPPQQQKIYNIKYKMIYRNFFRIFNLFLAIYIYIYLTELLLKIKIVTRQKFTTKENTVGCWFTPVTFCCDHFDVKKRVASKQRDHGNFWEIFQKNCHISRKKVMKLPRLLKNLDRFF